LGTNWKSIQPQWLAKQTTTPAAAREAEASAYFCQQQFVRQKSQLEKIETCNEIVVERVAIL